nr:hypothetical protein CFP56_79327 [Quercus suber]
MKPDNFQVLEFLFLASRNSKGSPINGNGGCKELHRTEVSPFTFPSMEDKYLFRFRRNHDEVEVISFLVILRYSNFALFFKMHFLIFKCGGLYNDF